MKRNLFANAALGIIASVSVGAQQPPPLRLNVPYNCPGNMIVVVKRCENKNKTDKAKQNDQSRRNGGGAHKKILMSKSQCKAFTFLNRKQLLVKILYKRKN